MPGIACGIFIASLIFAFCRYKMNDVGIRKVYYFPSYDSKRTCVEIRYLSEIESENKTDLKQNQITYFVDDLLLGPMTNRYKRLFASGTTAEFCFIDPCDKKKLNVGLSEEALNESSETAAIKEGVELLKMNIVKNFTNINTVDVFIAGKSIWTEEGSF